MSNVFEVGKAYSFQVYPSNIIENVFDHVVCVANLSGHLASRFMDIEAMHAQVYPYLPKGTIDSASEYNYVQFQLRDGSLITLGLPWINLDKVEVSNNQMIVAKIRNISVNRVNDILNALHANGFDDVELLIQAEEPRQNNIANKFYHP